MAEKKDPDPFPHLPRRSFYMEPGQINKFTTAPAETPPKAEKIAALKQHIKEQVKVLVIERVSIDVVAPAAAEPASSTTPPSKKRGRPVADKPWEREGISRMTWYRRRKEKPDG